VGRVVPPAALAASFNVPRGGSLVLNGQAVDVTDCERNVRIIVRSPRPRRPECRLIPDTRGDSANFPIL